MNKTFQNPSVGDSIYYHDKITHAITPDLSFTEESAVARVIIDAYVKEAREPNSVLQQDGLYRFQQKESFGDGVTREFEILSESVITVENSLNTANITDELNISRIKAKAFATSGLMQQMISAQTIVDAEYQGDRVKLNSEQKLLFGMAQNDINLKKDIESIAIGDFASLSPSMANTMREIMVKSAEMGAQKHQSERLEIGLALNVNAMEGVLEQRRQIEDNRKIFENEINFPKGKGDYPDMSKLDLALKFVTEKDKLTAEDRREFIKGENVAPLKAIRVLVQAGYEEGLKTGLSDTPVIPRAYGHSSKDVRTAAAVMVNGAFGEIKSPSLLATMTMNLADAMASSRINNFENNKYIGAGNFSGLDQKETQALKEKLLDVSGPNVEFAYEMKKILIKDIPDLDPVQTAKTLAGSANQLSHNLAAQQQMHMQGRGMGM